MSTLTNAYRFLMNIKAVQYVLQCVHGVSLELALIWLQNFKVEQKDLRKNK